MVQKVESKDRNTVIQLQGDEEHVSGWDLIFDNGYIEIDPAQCSYTSFLGTVVPVIAPSDAADPHPSTL